MDLEPCFIDIETFIQEIENRPALWDVDHPDYRCKSAKRACWEELAEMFGDCDNIERLRLLGSVLQKKWKNLRDNYAKELKRQRQQGAAPATDPDGKRHVPYVYFDRLSFLDKSVSNRGGTSNLFPELYERDAEESSTAAPADLTPEQPRHGSPDGGGRRSSSTRPMRVFKQVRLGAPYFSDSPTFLKNGGKPVETKPDLEQLDGDKHFCLGLYKELKKVPEAARMRTKIELMEVIQRAQQGEPLDQPKPAPAPTRTVTRYLVNYPSGGGGATAPGTPILPKIVPLAPKAVSTASSSAATSGTPQTITLIIPDQSSYQPPAPQEKKGAYRGRRKS